MNTGPSPQPSAMAPIRLGATDIATAPLGVGTWAWGDRRVWKFDPQHGAEDAADAYRVSVAQGVTLFDTAEVYGDGVSEKILGRLVREDQVGADTVIVATKFAPLPIRLRARSITEALDRSLERLGLPQVDLYQIHWPYTLLSAEGMADRLAEAVASGRTRAVGVSNYGVGQMRRFHSLLARRGVPLACNQVQYSLLHRKPETNGILEACRELDVTLIAYSPLAMGALTGKYGGAARPSSVFRRVRGSFRDLDRARPLLDALTRIGKAHQRTAAQVALNWLIRQPSVLAIPGARNEKQAADNADALGFCITDEEWEELDRLSRSWR